MRRRTEGESSFDLFLDAICNTFGGVVFIAILLAVLIQTRAVDPVDEAGPEESSSPAELAAIADSLETKTAEIQTLSTLLQELPPPSVGGGDTDAFEKLLAEHDATIANLSTTRQGVASRLKSIAELDRELQQLQDEADEIPKELSELEAFVAGQAETLDSLVAEKQSVVRTPRQRPTSARPVVALLKSGKIYFSSFANAASSALESDQVAVSTFATRQISFRAKAGTGHSLNAAATASQLDRAKSVGYYIGIAVWPDSYDDFEAFREMMVQRSLSYQLWPQDDEDELILSIGVAAAQVQ
ncbi:hypothetical protein [Crateriforma conspicua]|uniref:Uncharacterized protein n=1 Tax=Crateriforma conspicua TaxID=2527996 RepID=A0A5C6FUH9_9PLAN|nr:hypothetical protein [Crateriforma conspicua]TWU65934.1 hypothetical protein V7x_14880 [Crateriforma conspicua]